MKFCVIASGSAGNMTYVEAGSTKLLIDCGISLPNAINRLEEKNIDIDLKEVTDILITHEHDDHVAFIDTVVKKTKANLYINELSFKNLKPNVRDNLIGQNIAFLEGDGCYRIGDVEVCTLVLNHDCKNNFGFVIRYKNKQFGYFTDTGIFPSRYKYLLSELDSFVIEANHDVEMLQNSGRPYYLINRILSTTGHLSNQITYELLRDTLTTRTKNIVFAHVSRDCNSQSCIECDIISKFKDSNIKFLIAKQYEAIEAIEI